MVRFSKDFPLAFLAALVGCFAIGRAANPAEAADSDARESELRQQFAEVVLPFLQRNCLACHGPDTQEGKLELTSFRSIESVSQSHAVWEIVRERLEAAEMPPEDAEQQPTSAERQQVIDWIIGLRQLDASKNSGDPGRVLPRRLSNAEYNYSIRDLTGVDIRPTSEFPIDPANEAGFDNSGESLTMTPALLKKYLDAARRVAEHLVLKPDGFDFAEFPVVTDTDRDKYCVRRIVNFYAQQPVDLTDYFFAAWRYEHRQALGNATIRLEQLAEQQHVSPSYLATMWQLLNDDQDGFGPIAELRARWQALPAADQDLRLVRGACQAMSDYVSELRPKLRTGFSNLHVDGMHSGSQTLVLWKNRQYAAHRRTLNRQSLHVAGPDQPTATDLPRKTSQPRSASRATVSNRDPELELPVDESLRAAHLAAFERFCSVFPDAFFVIERGREYLQRKENELQQEQKGRLLSAGFHSMMGYFRDDQPLVELVLSDAERAQLDALWQELDFVTLAPMRQHSGFVWFERTDSRFMISPEFDFARAEDKSVTSEANIKRLAKVYLAKAIANGGEGAALDAITQHFERINRSIRWVESARAAAEPSHIDALVEFAKRAYRRSLTSDEQAGIADFYRTLCLEDGVDHEQAIRDTLTSILMSPHFFFRVNEPGGFSTEANADQSTLAQAASVPLSNNSLASRLSYFLWSSCPDGELLRAAESGELQDPGILVRHTQRMLRDARVRGLATEFGGNWLDFRHFEQHNSVDRSRFTSFNDSLRQAMFEEPIHFLTDSLQRDRSILELAYATHTFVNRPLANHYGLDDLAWSSPAADATEWIRVDDVRHVGRGGLLPMAVFQTANSPGLRTSPVKRGYWVVRRLLGEHIPPPPPNVPELPDNEALLGELSLRETLAVHREHASCAACHDRFDSIGLVFEGYGPIGELRSEDLGGRPVDTQATFPDGSHGTGVEGLKDYVRRQRQQDLIDNLSRKMLTYALGRSLQLSDDELIERIKQRLANEDYRFSALIESIVTSPQFTRMRPPELLTEVGHP